jgi:DNA-binding NtrC family response regulator
MGGSMVDYSYTGTRGKRDLRDEFQERHGIVGHSLEMREVVETVMQVAPTDITVLVNGESGTGKEVIANAIHQASKRSTKKFVAVNCGAIPEGILESELFGHEKGSFTGAVESRKGYFELADGGTVFLDEIGEMPISTQVKLLRVLENGEFMRVGSSETRSTNVRLIAATNKELEKEVQAKKFRQDLYYRLRSVTIRIPPLRMRKSDLPLLLDHFLVQIRKNNPGNSIRFSEEAVAAIMQHAWPGNVRELKHAIESIAVLEPGQLIDGYSIRKYLHEPEVFDTETKRPLPVRVGKSSDQAERELILRALFEIRNEIVDVRQMLENMNGNYSSLSLPAGQNSENNSDLNTAQSVAFGDFTLEEMEKAMILRALERFEGNRRLAAEALKISERTLYRKIRDYELS